ncbi:hypothetical protein [Novosphingobium sp. M1R2S20]|uniref:Uncharacterized protein n=1 Tax=Novosphingobium rhizovicinum TaxID=3228928 RepID=A0ABV3RCM1_9SPHN
MTTHRFHVLRIQCERILQSSLFEIKRSPSEVIAASIEAQPESVVRRNSEWHIAAPTPLSEGALAFQMGRVQSVPTPHYDDVKRVFFEFDTERAPFTWAVFDERTQACGVLRKTGVSLRATEVASKLERLLNASQVPQESGYNLYVEVIPDPEDFVDTLLTADKVVRFAFTARYENAFDVSRLIQRPAEQFNEKVGGEVTKVEVEGPDLSRPILEELTRGVAAVGEKATATVRENAGSKLRKILLQGAPLLGEFEWVNEQVSPLDALKAALREKYNSLRKEER